jgi:hypothetical protein
MIVWIAQSNARMAKSIGTVLNTIVFKHMDMTKTLSMRRKGRSVGGVLLDVDLLSQTVRFTQRETTEIVPIESSCLRTAETRHCYIQSNVNYCTGSHHQVVVGLRPSKGQLKSIFVAFADELEVKLVSERERESLSDRLDRRWYDDH